MGRRATHCPARGSATYSAVLWSLPATAFQAQHRLVLAVGAAPRSGGTGLYALLPLLALLALLAARRPTRRGSPRSRAGAALAPAGLLLVAGLVGKLLATFAVPGREHAVSATWHAVIDWSFLTHADLFAFGMAVAVLRVLHEDGRL